jgi:hypothetical protein
MKRLLILTGSAALLSIFAGCQKGGKGDDITMAANKQFPKFLVGTWADNSDRWELTIDAHGNVTSMRHPFISVPVDITRGDAYEEGRDGAHSVYILGPCTARYDRQKRELDVVINIDSFEIVLPIGTAEGKMIEYLKGPVSEDGSTWMAQWVNYVEMDGVEKPDLDSISPEPVAFTKAKPD